MAAVRGYMTMLLTDYFRSTPDVTWEFARQCGVEHGTIRLPEDAEFDLPAGSIGEAFTNALRVTAFAPSWSSRCRTACMTI